MKSVVKFLTSSSSSSFSLWLKILKLMIPISIAVKLLDEFGAITFLGNLLAPVMTLVGLPGVLGLVWAITLATNLWAGALMFVALSGLFHLTMAQVSVLGILMLMAHGLPLEIRMVQKCGVNLIFSLVLRVGSAIFLALLFNKIFTSFDILQTPANILIGTSGINDTSWYGWTLDQLESYIFVLVMLLALVLFLDILKKFGLIHKLGIILAPYLSLIGVTRKCAPITLVGMTLGLVYGGVLLVKELETGDYTNDDVLLSITSMNLFHSIIEDTIIVVLMGASLFWMLMVRFLFTVIIMKLISFSLNKNKSFTYKVMTSSAMSLANEDAR